MRRLVLSALPLVALAAFAAPVAVRAIEPDAPDLAVAVPAEADPAQASARVKQAIANRPANEILSISGTQRIDDQVIYVDTLRFDDGATMQLLAGNRDAIFIVAREVRLSGPRFRANIEFYDRMPANGADGAAPAAAPAQLPRSGGNGAAGQSGAAGQPGASGLTRKLPTVYIFVGNIRQSTGGPADFSDWRILADGIDGGTGGRGGRGQNGQAGQDGRHGEKDALGFCRKGPGSGGNGGAGGAFGPGGVGGNGGDGATVIFLAPATTVDAIKDVRVRNRGGLPGLGGLNGEPGQGGGGGSRGSRPGTCSGGSPGSAGPVGQAASTLRAPGGTAEGARGRVYYYTADLFN